MIDLKNNFKDVPENLKYPPEKFSADNFSEDMDSIVSYIYNGYSYLHRFSKEFLMKKKLMNQFKAMKVFGSKYEGNHDSTKSYSAGKVVTKLDGDAADIYILRFNGSRGSLGRAYNLTSDRNVFAGSSFVYNNTASSEWAIDEDSEGGRLNPDGVNVRLSGVSFVNSTNYPICLSLSYRVATWTYNSKTNPLELKAFVDGIEVWRTRYNQARTSLENMQIFVPAGSSFRFQHNNEYSYARNSIDPFYNIYTLEYSGDDRITKNGNFFLPPKTDIPPTSMNPSGFLKRGYRFTSWVMKMPSYLVDFAKKAYDFATSYESNIFNADKFRPSAISNLKKGDILFNDSSQSMVIIPTDNYQYDKTDELKVISQCSDSSICRYGSKWIPYVTSSGFGCDIERRPNVYYVNDSDISIAVTITIGSGALDNYVLEAAINVGDKYVSRIHIREGDVQFGSVDHVQRTIMAIVPPGEKYRLSLYRYSTIASNIRPPSYNGLQDPYEYIDEFACLTAWRELR